MEDVWRIFTELSRARQSGFTPSPISIADIKSYLDLCGYNDPEYREEVCTYIRAMDDYWLKWHVDRMKS